MKGIRDKKGFRNWKVKTVALKKAGAGYVMQKPKDIKKVISAVYFHASFSCKRCIFRNS
jgi:hypothetical protein